MASEWKAQLPKEIQTAIDALLAAPGKSDAGLRRAIFERTRAAAGEITADLHALVEKIEQRPWTVTDEDYDRLRQSYSEDQLFELTLAAATGAGLRRFEAGLRALGEDGEGA